MASIGRRSSRQVWQGTRVMHASGEFLGRHSRTQALHRPLGQQRIEMETGMRTVTEEHERLSSLVATCQETIKLWEDKKGVTLAANNVNDSICLWLSTLDGQLHSVDAKVSRGSTWTKLSAQFAD